MNTYGITYQGCDTVPALVSARTVQAAAEYAVEHCTMANGSSIPTSESNLAIENPRGGKTFFDVAANGDVTPTCRVNRDGRWIELGGKS